MKILAVAALLHLYSSVTAALSGNGSAETQVTAAPGDVALLPCYTGGVEAPISTTWIKNGRELIRGGGSSAAPTPEGQRLVVLRDGSLNIAAVVASDQGSYLCNATLRDNSSFRARVLLQVAGDPADLTISVSPTTALPNGTLYIKRGSNIVFNCSSSSAQPRQLTWAFKGASTANESLNSTSGSELYLRIDAIEPDAQGVYTCRDRNASAQQAVNASAQLLVYYIPDRHPECMWGPALDPYHLHTTCTWFGAYPTPDLIWGEDHDDGSAGKEGNVYESSVADSLTLTLNRSELYDGQTLKCAAEHPVLAPGERQSCSFTFRTPFPEGEPLVMAQEGQSVTLTCTETTSLPPANTTWKKGQRQEDVPVGPKYSLSGNGPVFNLTIRNVSKEDEGVYFCRSENPLAVRELEVYLTVRASLTYTGVIIGIFIATLIVGSAVVLAKALYSSRHRICLGGGFRTVDGENGDVLNLVESDDEQIFQDAVPRLPPVTNGRTTTLVQIHRIPSSDHEDLEAADTSPEQPEETVQTEEPEDLVTF